MTERLEEKLRETVEYYTNYKKSYQGILDGTIKEDCIYTAEWFREALRYTYAELETLVYVYFGENGRVQDALDQFA